MCIGIHTQKPSKLSKLLLSKGLSKFRILYEIVKVLLHSRCSSQYFNFSLVMGRALNSSGSGMLSDLSFGLGLNRAS